MKLAINWPVGAHGWGPHPAVMEHGWLYHLRLQADAVTRYKADDFCTWGVQPLDPRDGLMDLRAEVPLPKGIDDWFAGCDAVKCRRRWHYLWTPSASLLRAPAWQQAHILTETIGPTIFASGYRVILDSAGSLWDLCSDEYTAIPLSKRRQLLTLIDQLVPGDCGVEHISRKRYGMGARPSWTASHVRGPAGAYDDDDAAAFISGLDERHDATKFWEYRDEFGDGSGWYRAACWAAARGFIPFVESWQLDQLAVTYPTVNCENWREVLAPLGNIDD